MMRQYLPVIGGMVLIGIGTAFLFINMMHQTMVTFWPAFAAILAGIGVILWKLPSGK